MAANALRLRTQLLNSRWWILGAAAICWCATRAAATDLPQPIPVRQDNPSFNGSTSTMIRETPFPSVTASATDSTPGGSPTHPDPLDMGSNCVAELTYFMRVNPVAGIGSASVSVPLQIASNAVTEISGTTSETGWEATADVLLLTASGGVISGFAPQINLAESDTGGPTIPIISRLTTPFNAVSGTTYEFIIEASVSIEQNASPQTAEGTAIVDPVVSFDPNFDSSGYTLEFSPGIDDVPEPGSLSVLSLGLPLLVRRRSRWMPKNITSQA